MRRVAESRWALRRGIHATWSLFRAEAGALPGAAWRRWIGALALGVLVSGAVMAALTLLAWRLLDHGLQAWDRDLLLRIEDLPISLYQAIWWEAYGSSSVLIPLTVLCAALAARMGRPILAVHFVAAFVLARPIILVGWQMWDRARPKIIEGGTAAPPLHSFPSGHAFQTVAIYGLLIYLWLRRSSSVVERLLGTLVWLALAVAVSLARLRMGVHWPSDVIAGSIAGLSWVVFLVVALRRAEAAGGR